MYYSAAKKVMVNGKATRGEHCIGVATSEHPLSEWKAHDNYFYCPSHGGAIGVNHVVDGDKRYVVFKDGSDGKASFIALFEVSAKDGFTKLSGPTDISSQCEETNIGWEGPDITKVGKDGPYILIHTTGTFHGEQDKKAPTPGYELHWATSVKGKDGKHHITGPYCGTKGVLLQSGAKDQHGNELFRPGGGEFLNGNHNVMYFFAEDMLTETKRVMYVAELEYPGEA